MSNAFCKGIPKPAKDLTYNFFVEKVNSWSLITNFSKKKPILYIWQGSEYSSAEEIWRFVVFIANFE